VAAKETATGNGKKKETAETYGDTGNFLSACKQDKVYGALMQLKKKRKAQRYKATR
jgi:hypothetical protein